MVCKTTIIAEAGVNHNGSISMAKELIDVAADAGADFVKFQTFKAEKIISRVAPKAEYQMRTTDESETQLEMVKKLELDADAHKELIDHCIKRDIQFLSTPFDIESVTLLVETLNLSQLKISSGEITNAPLLLTIARTGKPVILSTGMSNLGDIEQALSVLAYGYLQPTEKPTAADFNLAYFSPEGQNILRDKVTLLHCTTEYPAPYEDVNLKVMDTLKSAFNLPIGYSDHTQGIVVPLAAVALGATVIEKHFTLNRNLPGPDHKASLEPNELRDMVQGIRQVEAATGGARKIPSPDELKNRLIARKSIVATTSIKAGEHFTEKNITTKRPGTGMSPLQYWELLGRLATKDYTQDEMISL